MNAGVVLETDDGFGALYCSGLPERRELDAVPDGLLAEPRLSVQREVEIGRAADLRVEADWSTKVRDRRAGEALAREMQYRLVSTKLASIAVEIRQFGGFGVTNLRLTNASHRPRRDGDEFVFELDLEPGEERLSYRLSGRVAY